MFNPQISMEVTSRNNPIYRFHDMLSNLHHLLFLESAFLPGILIQLGGVWGNQKKDTFVMWISFQNWKNILFELNVWIFFLEDL